MSVWDDVMVCSDADWKIWRHWDVNWRWDEANCRDEIVKVKRRGKTLIKDYSEQMENREVNMRKCELTRSRRDAAMGASAMDSGEDGESRSHCGGWGPRA